MRDEEHILIFNIQKYSLHDGAGIRTVVFLKGCPLRCLWCCNPESQAGEKELIYRKSRCIGIDACGLCLRSAPSGAVCRGEDGRAVLAVKRCKNDLGLASVCPSGAIGIEGRDMPVEELIDIVKQDEVFYRGRGGLTLSGGEPLAQKGSLQLLRRAKEERLGTAVETCGYVEQERLLEAAAYLDQIFFDVKSMNEDRHREYTGVSNGRILSNLKAVRKAFPEKKLRVRTPVIPGFNDSEKELAAIEAFLRSIGISDWEKLPYHTYGVGKYEMLGREYLLPKACGAPGDDREKDREGTPDGI